MNSINVITNFYKIHVRTHICVEICHELSLRYCSKMMGSKKDWLCFPFSFYWKDGCIVCPTTDSTFDLRTGEMKEWYPKNPVLRALTPALRNLFVYPVKTDEENIYISMRGGLSSDASAEIVFSGKAQPGITATDVNVDEVTESSLYLFFKCGCPVVLEHPANPRCM